MVGEWHTTCHTGQLGQAHVVSYLCRLGADVDLGDNSGNTPTHYACAYGWFECLQLLREAGANVNATNDWLLSPVAVAYLKGHTYLVDWLLQVRFLSRV